MSCCTFRDNLRNAGVYLLAVAGLASPGNNLSQIKNQRWTSVADLSLIALIYRHVAEFMKCFTLVSNPGVQRSSAYK